MNKKLYKVSLSEDFGGTKYVLADSMYEALDILSQECPGKSVTRIEFITSKILTKK